MKRIRFSKKEVEEIIDLYENGHSLEYICKKFHCSRKTIRKNLINKKVSIKSQGRKKTNYKVNDSFFSYIDNEIKAYILGFLLADGGVCYNQKKENVGLNIRLQTKDKEHLEKIKNNLIIGDFPLKNVSSKDKRKNKTYYTIGFCLYSKKMINDLNPLGFIKNKAKYGFLPKIKNNLVKHMLRGLFDGDGSFFYYFSNRKRKYKTGRFEIISNISVIKDIAKIFDSLSIEYKIRNEIRVQYLWYISIMKVSELLKIYEYLYSDAIIFLKRKKNKFDEFILYRKELAKQNKGFIKYRNLFQELEII